MESRALITLRLPRLDESTCLALPSDLRFGDALAQLQAMLSDSGRLCEEVTSPSTLVVDATLYPSRELGSLDEARARTLFQLGLFPSATLDLVRPCDAVAGEELWTLHVKPVAAPASPLAVRYLRGRDTVHVLKARLAAAHPALCAPANCLVLVYMGQVLANGGATLRSCGLGDGASLVCIRKEGASPVLPLPSRHTASPAASPAAPAATPGAAQPAASSAATTATPTESDAPAAAGAADDDDGPPMCRICHGGSEDGPLVRPCRCSGSMRHCHLDCLNTWRRLAPTEASFRRCDQCGFEYRFERSAFAAWLLSDAGGAAAAALACVALLYLGAWLVHLLLPSNWLRAFRSRAWSPRLPNVLVLGNRRLPCALWWPDGWRRMQRHLDFVCGGAYALGALGFVDFMWREFLRWRLMRAVDAQGNLYHNAHAAVTVAWIWALVSGHGDLGRVVVVVGLAISAKGIVVHASAKAREVASCIGERLLEVA